jgi:RNA polymerase sigma-70 factor (ECF subfamily)
MYSNEKIDKICKDIIYEQIYKKYISLVRNFIYYKYGNLENAEDIAQNAFIKLWENCDKVSIDKAKNFLFTTANNMSLNNYKHEKVVLNFNTTPQKKITHETPEFQMIEKEFYTKIQTTIASLSEKQREVFLLNRIEKLKYSEIAELLNISVKAVEKRMHLALVIMREKIGNV